MKYLKYVFILLTLLFLCACTGTEIKQMESDPGVVQTKSGAEDLALQPAAKDAKDKAGNMKQVKYARAVELNRDLFVVIEPKHQYTFQSETLTKKLKSELEKEWPDKEVRVTTDHKFFLELDKLEKRIQNETITKNTLNIELDKLKKLLEQQN